MSFSHVLATRPEPQQTELVQGLSDLGVDVVSLPAFEFEALPPPADLPDRARDALVVFTSPRAVSYGLAALGGELPPGARAAAIGPATRAALAAQGIEALQAPGTNHDSEALLATIDRQPLSGRALILAAPGGREALQRGFIERGWDVTLAPVYRRVPRAPDIAEASRLGEARKILSLWTSGVAMDQLLEGLGDAESRAVLAGTAVVASDRLAALAERHGFSAVTTAENATNSALLGAVRRCLEAPSA